MGAVVADDTDNFTCLSVKTDIVQRLEWGALFNRLTSEPPPLVERGGLQALQLAELELFGDVVHFDDGHSWFVVKLKGAHDP